MKIKNFVSVIKKYRKESFSFSVRSEKKEILILVEKTLFLLSKKKNVLASFLKHVKKAFDCGSRTHKLSAT